MKINKLPSDPLPCEGSEFADQVLVGVANDIQTVDAAGAHVQARIVEIGEQVLQSDIALFGLSQGGFGVEADVAEHSFQLRYVFFFNSHQSLIDDLAQVGCIALFVKGVIVRAFGEHKAFPAHAPEKAFFVLAVLGFVLVVVVSPHVRDIFDEQHHQDIVLVFGGIDRTAEGVAGFPEDVVDFVLGDVRRIVHWLHYYSVKNY